VTVPPTVLVFHASLSWLNYKVQRYIWLVFQWLLLLGSLLLFSQCTSSQMKSKIIWISGLFFIGSSFFWRLHVERGQIYILYVFLIALAYWIYKKRNSEIWSGIIAGITMSLRPPLIVLSLPMLIFKKFKFIMGNIIGFVIGIGTTFMFASPSVWYNYYTAMKTHGIIHFNLQYSSSFRYPYQDIEGITNLWILAEIPIFDTSLQYLVRSIGIDLTSNMLLIMLIITLIISSLIIRRIIYNRGTFNSIIFSGIVLVFVTDYFLPAARFSYNNVMILPIILLAIIDSNHILRVLNKNGSKKV